MVYQNLAIHVTNAKMILLTKALLLFTHLLIYWHAVHTPLKVTMIHLWTWSLNINTEHCYNCFYAQI